MGHLIRWASPALLGLIVPELFQDAFEWLRESGWYPYARFGCVVWLVFVAVYELPITPRTKQKGGYRLGSTVIVGLLCAAAWWFLVGRAAPTVDADAPATGDKNLATVIEQQKRLEFLQHRADAVSRVTFRISLDKAYSLEEVGKFQILLTVLKPSTGTIYVSSFGPAHIEGLQIGGKPAPPGVQHTAWQANQDLKFTGLLQDTMMSPTQGTVNAWSAQGGPFATINDFDNALLLINLSASLWPKVAVASVLVNDYVLFHQPRECLAVAAPVHAGNPQEQVDWPIERRPAPNTEWLKVVPAHYKPGGRIPPILGFRLVFSAYTPVLVRDLLSGDKAANALPTCDWYGANKP